MKYPLKKENRVKKTTPKGARSQWCSCDMAKVRPGEKCSSCHHRPKNKHQKP